jgi:hypothetical protein
MMIIVECMYLQEVSAAEKMMAKMGYKAGAGQFMHPKTIVLICSVWCLTGSEPVV